MHSLPIAMKKIFPFLLAAVLGVTSAAQTAREFTLPLTPDGSAELVVYLPENPTGRAVVACPGGG